MPRNPKTLSHEELVSDLIMAAVRCTMFSKPSYSQELLKLEYETVSRLGGNWSQYCSDNGYTKEMVTEAGLPLAEHYDVIDFLVTY